MSDIVSPGEWRDPGGNWAHSHFYLSCWAEELESRLNPKCILAKTTLLTSYKCLNFGLLKSCLKKASWLAFSCANISKQSKPYHGKCKVCLGKIAWTANTDLQTAPGVLGWQLPSSQLTTHHQQVPFAQSCPPTIAVFPFGIHVHFYKEWNIVSFWEGVIEWTN